jgi:hypothetical protein
VLDAQIARVTRELEDIEVELAADAAVAGLTLQRARVVVAERRALLERVTLDAAPITGTPRHLARAIDDLRRAERQEAELARLTTPRGRAPGYDTDWARRNVTFAREIADAQLRADRTFVALWSDELAALPATATPAQVARARLVALRAAIRQGLPSDAPAFAHRALQNYRFARRMHDTPLPLASDPSSRELAREDLRESQGQVDAANDAAAADLTSRIEATTPGPSSLAVARRAALVAELRELRRQVSSTPQ